MEPSVLLVLIGAAGLVAALIARFFEPRGLFSAGRGRIPKHFEVSAVVEGEIPADTRDALEAFETVLEDLGFHRDGTPVRIPTLKTLGHDLIVVPFAHADERSVFVLGIDARWAPRSELMLHILTPLSGGRRVETSSLDGLQRIRPPDHVDLRVVLPDSVPHMWSHHRRALGDYQRAEREPLVWGEWQSLVAAAYADWVRAAVRAQRLRLEPGGDTYRLRST